MSTTTTMQAHIAYELIENTKHQVVVIEYVSQDITSSAHARELGVSVSVRKGATFSVQLGPPQWLRVESFEEA
jgi:hypothetical protein